MVDHISPEHRSWNMSRIRGKDTSPELVVRSYMHNLGFRFRLHKKNLPGRPDLILPKYNTVMFVHGCFWHQCPNCERGSRIPKSNVDYWEKKLNRNIERDRQHVKDLRGLGYKVITIWECQTKSEASLRKKIRTLISARKNLD